jgi:hypothetical protein
MGHFVLNIGLMFSKTDKAMAPKSGPRWSIVGLSMARKTRSGTFDGPGICKKWRPRRGALLFVIVLIFNCY